MFCAECQHENRGGARFCEACGAALAVACPECGAELRAGARFCDQCGTPVPLPTKTAPSATAKGERRNVTVLFADAVGHTQIAEQLGEEQTYELMQGCFARMQRAVEQYGGSVNQYTGDGILALFGAPLAHEHSARRAVAAALAMQHLLNEYREEVHSRYPVQCAYRIGLNTGPVVVGSISEKLDLEVAAVGDTVNLAARMQTLAEPGTVCVSEHTFRAVQDYFEFENLGEHEVKGKSAPVRVYRPLRERAVQNRLEVSLERGLTPYTGREQEQKVLAGYLNKAANGQGQVVLVSGEAGIGKSRTLFEFNRAVDRRQQRWIGGQCISFGEHIPYLPVIDLLKSAFAIGEADKEADIVAKVDAAVSEWADPHRATAPYIRFLLNVDPGDESVAAMDPQIRRAGFFDAFRAVVTELSSSNPLIIAIEDLHWVDDQSEEIIGSLVDYIARLPVLLLMTARPGYKGTFDERSHFNRMALTQLTSDATAAMVERALASSGLPAELQSLIAAKAEGNPFFIEEVLRSLAETGAIRETNGSYTLECDPDALMVPDTIQEVILARIDRLAPGAKEAVQLASVIGREFTVRLLNRISDLEDRLTDTLSELKSLELIYESGFMPELSYMFKHALTHDVAYSTLLTDRRRRLHRTVAEAIETLFADRISEHYEALGYHYELAEDWERALEYLRKSGDKAAAAFANREAIGYYTRAIAAVDNLSADFARTRASILQSRALIYDTMSDFQPAIDDCIAAAKIFHELGDTVTESIALSLRAVVEWENHDFDAAESVGQEALTLAGRDHKEARFAALSALCCNYTSTGRRELGERYWDELQALSTQVDVPHFQATWAMDTCLDIYWQGRFEDAIAFYERWRYLTDRIAIAKVASDWVYGMCLTSLGHYGHALQHLLDTLAFAERVGSGFFGCRITNTVGWLYNEIQDYEQSLPWNERSLELTLKSDMPDIEIACNSRLNLGEALVGLGRFNEALAQYRDVERIVRNPRPEYRMSLHNYSMHWFHAYGEWELARGDAETALGLADECIALAEANKRRRYVVKGLRLRGEAKMALGESAGEDLEAAVDLARRVGNPTQLWKSLVALGEWRAQAGDASGVAAALKEAADVVGSVADGLDDTQRRVFLDSSAIHALREAVERF
jgi:class 3 adenylate cyclase/tetratricopeptide (TPR) repeat protein